MTWVEKANELNKRGYPRLLACLRNTIKFIPDPKPITEEDLK